MAIATSTATGAPFAKLTELGDKLIGALGSDTGKSRRQARNFETQDPAFKPDGKPLLEEVLHLVTMPGSTARIGDRENGNIPESGTHVRFALRGFKWSQAIQARKDLPAYSGVAAGRDASGDVYTIELVGWSAETKNPTAAQQAGFTVVDGRIVLRSQDEKDRYVLAQSRSGGNTNPAVDLAISIRRPNSDEKIWEQKADELYLTKPWEAAAGDAEQGGSAGGPNIDEEPF